MVEMMSHFRHINLIQVIGCCTDNGQQLLVCEFAKNGSVLERLYSENAPAFDWETRAAVCLGTARGLSFLHNEISPRIIHRDINPSNIILDANFVPEIVDFDLIHFDGESVHAEGEKQTAERTEFAHLGLGYCSTFKYTAERSESVVGTLGYLDPYYMQKGEFSRNSDVYSFGIAMLEIITGRRPILGMGDREGNQHKTGYVWLLDWVTRVMKDGMVLKIVDPKLTDFPKEDVERFINVALLCTRETHEQRPIMFDVVNMLYGRHKFDQEISEMATCLIADRLAQRNSFSSAHTPGLTYSLSSTTTIEARDGRASTEIDYAAAMESRKEPVDDTSSGNSSSVIVYGWDVSESKGECSSSAAALAPLETRLACSTQENQSCPEDAVKAHFKRSMEKIMRYHGEERRNRNNINTIMTQTTVIKKSSANMFKEAVYPPYLSGEFHRRPSHF